LLLVAAVFLGVEAVLATPSEPAAAITLAVITAIAGTGLAAAARGVARAKRWSRSPVLVWQALQAAAAMSAVLPGGWYLRVVLLAASVLAGAGVLRRDVLPTGGG
jgi:hypothetical protein